jgi:lambda repressor-like predicted transcriptional regulator
MNPARAYTRLHVLEAIGYYRTGYTLRYIAAEQGFSTTTIRKALAREGVQMRERVGARDTGRDEAIKKMYERGASLAAIGRKYSLTRQRVYQIIQQQGKNR